MNLSGFRVTSFMLLLMPLFLLLACTPSRLVKPLKKGEQTVSGSFGGQLIKFGGAVIPIPFTSVAYAKGLNDKASVFGGIHTTALLFANMQVDAGICADVWKKDKFAFSITPALQTAVSFKDYKSFRLWPSLDWNARYELPKGFVYAGMHNWFEFSKIRSFDAEQKKFILPGYHIGYTITKTKWQHQLEVKYLLPMTSIYPGVVDYIGINNKGAFGFYYSLCRMF
jgi:hypothetical protein